MPQPSVCVIGAGAVGLAAAVYLLRRGCAVTVIERDLPASGSSALSVGVIETQYIEPLDIQLRVQGLGFFRELERNHGLEITRTGYLRLAHSSAEAERFAASVEYQRELGVADARVLDADEILKLVPDMDVSDVTCGLWGPSDGFIDGHLYCSLLAELATGAGATLLVRRPNWKVKRLRGRAFQVDTGQEVVRAEYIVNAAGAWAPRVAEQLGVHLPLEPQRHEAVVVHLGRELEYVMPMVMDYAPHSGEVGLYFRHERRGQLIAGLHSEEVLEDVATPDAFARSVSAEFLEGVAQRISKRVPGLSGSSLAHGWAGLYPSSPDGIPQVGPSAEDPHIVAAGGAGGSGIQLSPIMGELVADWIVDGEPRAVSCGYALDPRREALQRERSRGPR